MNFAILMTKTKDGIPVNHLGVCPEHLETIANALEIQLNRDSATAQGVHIVTVAADDFGPDEIGLILTDEPRDLADAHLPVHAYTVPLSECATLMHGPKSLSAALSMTVLRHLGLSPADVTYEIAGVTMSAFVKPEAETETAPESSPTAPPPHELEP